MDAAMDREVRRVADVYPGRGSVRQAPCTGRRKNSLFLRTICFQAAGLRIDVDTDVTRPIDPERFPCPFCDSDRVDVIGGSRTFLYYRCADCAEAWTAMNLRASAPKRMPLLLDLPHPTIH